MINQALPQLHALGSPRAQAYALVGLSYLVETLGALTYSFPYPHLDSSKESAEFLPEDFIAELIESMVLNYTINIS
jgi:hypothetical protein